MPHLVPFQCLEKKWNSFKRAFSSHRAFSEFMHVKPTLDNDGNINTWINEGPIPPCLLDSVAHFNRSQANTSREAKLVALFYREFTLTALAWSWFNYLIFYFGVGFGNWTLGSVRPQADCFQLLPIADHDRDWPQLVAIYRRNFHITTYCLRRNLFCLSSRRNLPHSVSLCRSQCVWDVGKLLLCRSKSYPRAHLV
jgi:hypothetical protein